jgi:hypothetical protein
MDFRSGVSVARAGDGAAKLGGSLNLTRIGRVHRPHVASTLALPQPAVLRLSAVQRQENSRQRIKRNLDKESTVF